jgi:hypothetical protein
MAILSNLKRAKVMEMMSPATVGIGIGSKGPAEPNDTRARLADINRVASFDLLH